MIASPKGTHWRPIHPTPTTEDRPDRADLPVRPTRVQITQRRASDMSSDTLPAATSNPQPDNTVPRHRNPQPRAPNFGGPFTPQVLQQEEIRTRHQKATTRHRARTKANRIHNQHTLFDYWPSLLPPSLPVRPPGQTRPSLLPRSLPSMGWKPDPAYIIRPDCIQGTTYPFPHSPPGSPHSSDEHILPTKGQQPATNELRGHQRDTSLTESNPHTTAFTGSEGKPSTSGPVPPIAEASANTILTLLTINAQKAGTNSPSLSDIVTMIDEQLPDVLFITETPCHTRSGALQAVLRNRGFALHYNPANAPSSPDTLPEARIPAHITHPGGGAWLAYRKHAPWSSTVRPLTLPMGSSDSTICAVELTMLTGTKVALISCYPPPTTRGTRAGLFNSDRPNTYTPPRSYHHGGGLARRLERK